MTVGQVYGSGTGIGTNIPPPPDEPMDAENADFWTKVDQFKRKADEAYTLWQKLRAKRQAALTNPALKAEYDAVMGEAENLAARASDVERAAATVKQGFVETVKSWLPGFSGAEFYRNAREDGQLGFIQVIAVAAVMAAIAWVGTWIVKGNIVDRKLTAVENLIDKGVSPGQAGALIEERGDPGPLAALFGNLGTGIAIAGTVGLVLYFFVQKKQGF